MHFTGGLQKQRVVHEKGAFMYYPPPKSFFSPHFRGAVVHENTIFCTTYKHSHLKILFNLDFNVYLHCIEQFWFAIHDQMALHTKTLDHGKREDYLPQCKNGSGPGACNSRNAYGLYCLFITRRYVATCLWLDTTRCY